MAKRIPLIEILNYAEAQGLTWGVAYHGRLDLHPTQHLVNIETETRNGRARVISCTMVCSGGRALVGHAAEGVPVTVNGSALCPRCLSRVRAAMKPAPVAWQCPYCRCAISLPADPDAAGDEVDDHLGYCGAVGNG